VFVFAQVFANYFLILKQNVIFLCFISVVWVKKIVLCWQSYAWFIQQLVKANQFLVFYAPI